MNTNNTTPKPPTLLRETNAARKALLSAAVMLLLCLQGAFSITITADLNVPYGGSSFDIANGKPVTGFPPGFPVNGDADSLNNGAGNDAAIIGNDAPATASPNLSVITFDVASADTRYLKRVVVWIPAADSARSGFGGWLEASWDGTNFSLVPSSQVNAPLSRFTGNTTGYNKLVFSFEPNELVGVKKLQLVSVGFNDGADYVQSRFAEVDIHAINRQTEVATLNGLLNVGDVGYASLSPDDISPTTLTGQSLKLVWAGGPSNYWDLIAPITQNVDLSAYDTLSGKLFIDANQGANLAIYLRDNKGDRFYAYNAALASAPLRGWYEFQVPRSTMGLEGAPDWSKIKELVIAPNQGSATFYVDSLRLEGTNQPTLFLIDNRDDGYVPFGANASVAMDPKIPSGSIVLPFDLTGALAPSMASTPADFKTKLGVPQIALPLAGFNSSIKALADSYRSQGVIPAHYSQYALGYRRWLINRQGYDNFKDGRSFNHLSQFEAPPNWLLDHTPALGAADTLAMAKLKIDALASAGISTWIVPDYVFAYFDGLWGYSPKMKAAYVRNLNSQDSGLRFVTNGTEQTIKFWDYFAQYNGFVPTPSTFNIASWNDFTPPSDINDGSPKYFERLSLFCYLRAYEWLKAIDQAGQYYKGKGGQGLWVIPNPEDIAAAGDFGGILRLKGASNLLIPCFGRPGDLSEAAYSSYSFLRRQADKGGTAVSVLFETGAGGHSSPYWNSKVAYAATYALAASAKAEYFENDFSDESSFAVQGNPTNIVQHARYRDVMTKATSYLQSRTDGATRPAASILCLANRAPGRILTSSMFFSPDQNWGFGLALSRSHLMFDHQDNYDYSDIVNNYKVIAYSPISPKVGELNSLVSWLNAAPNRILVTHTFVPTRDGTGFWGVKRGDESLGTAPVPSGLGLGNITRSTNTVAQINNIPSATWRKYFSVGRVVNLPSPLTVRSSTGSVLVGTSKGPLVSQTTLSNGSKVIYLHFSSYDANNVEVLDLTMRAMQAIAETAAIKPFVQADGATMTQLFDISGGKVLVAWDQPTQTSWNWVYQEGLPALNYSAPGVSRTIRVPVSGTGSYTVYNFLSNATQTVTPTNGTVPVTLSGAVSGLYYIGSTASSQFSGVLSNAQNTRAKLATQFSFDQ